MESQNCEYIEADIIFDEVLSRDLTEKLEYRVMNNVEKLLEEKNRKINDLENDILVIKKHEEKLKNVINYIVKDLHYTNELQNIQPIYDSDGNIVETIVNEGWLDRRVPKTFDENGFWKTYELDGKIYEIKEKGVIIEIKNN